MSKYFNSTLRTQRAVIYDDILKPAMENGAPAEAPAKVAPVPEAPPSVPEKNPLDDCKTIRLPLEKLPHAQFRDSQSLEPAEESYRALRTRLLRAHSAQGIHSVVITSALQGDGKTLTSLNLALCCAQLHGMRLLLVDADVRNCGLSRAIEAPTAIGLADVLSGNCEGVHAVLGTDQPNLFVVPSGMPSMPAAELFASKRWPEFIAWAKGNFDLILVDSPPVLVLSDVELITAGCDAVLMVVRAMYTKRQTLQKCAKQIDPKKLLGVVYNGVPEGSHHRYNYRGYGEQRQA